MFSSTVVTLLLGKGSKSINLVSAGGLHLMRWCLESYFTYLHKELSNVETLSQRLPLAFMLLQAESEGWGDAGELNWGDSSW